MSEVAAAMSLVEAAQILGVEPASSQERFRDAYLAKVQQHPPDRDPDVFEKIRDAYNVVRDPTLRARAAVFGSDADTSLATLLDSRPSGRVFAGTQTWINLLNEKRH